MRLLFFTADWSRDTEEVKPVIESVTDDPGYDVEVIDVDENLARANDLGVNRVPSLVLMHDGDVKALANGATDIKQAIENLL